MTIAARHCRYAGTGCHFACLDLVAEQANRVAGRPDERHARRDDGIGELDVRGTFKTDDGALIYMTYKGVVARGDAGLYWRVTPVFNTASEKYDWLNHIVCVGKSKQIDTICFFLECLLMEERFLLRELCSLQRIKNLEAS